MRDTGTEPTFGFTFHPTFPPETLAAFAQKTEAAGFDELWLWNDCFLPGALTSAAIALSATRQLSVGIGLLPVPAYNPLFAAMDITTLARAYPRRILPGFGHGVGAWMEQIGAAPKSSMKALREFVEVERRLLRGEQVTIQGDHVHLDRVQMQTIPEYLPPLYVGAMREKSLRLAGRIGDGTILTSMSSLEYVRWAVNHIRAGMAETGRTHHRVVVSIDVKVGLDGKAARAAARRALAERLPWADVHTDTLGITAEVAEFLHAHDTAEAVAQNMPDEWVDAFCAAGTPDQVREAIQRWVETGVDSVVLQPLNGDPECLDEYIRYLMPLRKGTS